MKLPILLLLILSCGAGQQTRRVASYDPGYNEAERRAIDECFGGDVRPCGGSRRLNSAFREAIRQKDADEISKQCEAARAREGENILTTGCAAW